MAYSANARKLLASTGVLLAVGAGLTGCDAFGNGCGKGAASPEEAVEEFISAAVADDAKKACSVGEEVATTENIQPAMAKYREKYADRDLSKLTFENLPDLRMGSSFVVKVAENGREIERINVAAYKDKYQFPTNPSEDGEDQSSPADSERPSASTEPATSKEASEDK